MGANTRSLALTYKHTIMKSTVSLQNIIDAESQRLEKAYEGIKSGPPQVDIQHMKNAYDNSINRHIAFGFIAIETGGEGNSVYTIFESPESVTFDLTNNIPDHEMFSLLERLYSDYWNISKGWKAAREAKDKLEADLKVWSKEQNRLLDAYVGRKTNYNTSYSAWESKWFELRIEFDFPYVLTQYNADRTSFTFKSTEDFTFSVSDDKVYWQRKQEGAQRPTGLIGRYHSFEECLEDLKAKGYNVPEPHVAEQTT